MLSRESDRFCAEKRYFYEVQQPHHPAIKFYLVVLVGIEVPQDHGPMALLLVCWLFRSVRAPLVLSLVMLFVFPSCTCRAEAAILFLAASLSDRGLSRISGSFSDAGILPVPRSTTWLAL